jgi:NAD(P)-dependent dehydrogenase (short-subunit alcohol dehydrogenase family)
MSVAAAIDKSGVAVITGGASGFGFNMAERLLTSGMSVAILDVSTKELEQASAKLASFGKALLAVSCNVTKFADCVTANKAIGVAFPGKPISFLFNNAGISGQDGGHIIDGDRGAEESWAPIFAVNVFGAVNILKAFVPDIVATGRLPSGKATVVVTTSSVVGLLNHNPGPYSISKMAATAICEQFSLELEGMGEAAAHISPHSLHPTVAATNFLTSRDDKGLQGKDDQFMSAMAKIGTTTAEDIIDGLFKGLDENKYYIIVDHETDVPTTDQIKHRMQVCRPPSSLLPPPSSHAPPHEHTSPHPHLHQSTSTHPCLNTLWHHTTCHTRPPTPQPPHPPTPTRTPTHTCSIVTYTALAMTASSCGSINRIR